MHRASPISAAFRAYTGGGARSVVDKVDDGQLMQEMTGKFMAGEKRDKVESPQNYGFTSTILPSQGKKGAEAFMSFPGGNRSFPVAAVMDDRRHRPMGLKPGENSQYDDIGQMTLMRRNGLYLLTLDSEDDSQQQGGQGGQGGSGRADSGSGQGQGQKTERMVSLRHVEKQKQDRTVQQTRERRLGETIEAYRAYIDKQAQDNEQQKQQFKHEGESVNTEVRCTKNRIEFRAGDRVVGYYDVKEDTWFFTAKLIHSKATSELKDEAPKINHN